MARPVRFYISVLNIVLMVFILLLGPVDTQGPITPCVPEIKIRKNTVYQSSSESMLNISCPVTYCKEIPAVAWIKINDASKFIRISATNQVTITQVQTGPNELISYLIFKNISADNSGIYRCMIPSANFSLESHNVNVNVSDSINTSKGTNPEIAVSDVRWLLYVFIGLGILSLVLVVMLISFLCINRYSRKANSPRHKNAAFCPKPPRATTSGKSQEIPEEQNNIYDAPTDDLSSEVGFLYTGNTQECPLVMRSGNRSGDLSQQVVYASLQHPSPREPPAVRHQSREHQSEYASIRIS